MNTRPFKRGQRATLDNLAERFWSKVAKGDGCWEWQGVRTSTQGSYAYGRLRRIYGQKGMTLAHRISYELHVGPIPPGMEICHHCDNPPCVRPDHLFLGTHRDNLQDASRKGRARGKPRPGASHSMAKLSAADVAEIRRRFASGESNKALAGAFGIDRSHMWAITTGRSWRTAA